jgi:TetR/AcrR family transcriptional regulator
MPVSSVEKPRPGRPKDPIRRQRILEAACRAFAAHGYDGTSLSDVAAAVDLSKAAVLHHFATKEALYFEVLTETLGDLGGMVAVAASANAAFGVRLDRLGATVVEYLGTRPGAARLVVTELIGRGPFVQGPGKRPVAAALAAVAAFLRGGMDEGAIAAQSPEHLAMSILGVHVLWFSASDLTAGLLGADPFDPAHIEARKQAVLRSVRGLCGIGRAPSAA